mmetsp:Transcript_9764/g.41796  ORF Transcript_9764/g.41796 Transcript_9764/m.41796 type:complete len:244 (-) Transcript_9764:715-1446(-)
MSRSVLPRFKNISSLALASTEFIAWSTVPGSETSSELRSSPIPVATSDGECSPLRAPVAASRVSRTLATSSLTTLFSTLWVFLDMQVTAGSFTAASTTRIIQLENTSGASGNIFSKDVVFLTILLRMELFPSEKPCKQSQAARNPGSGIAALAKTLAAVLSRNASFIISGDSPSWIRNLTASPGSIWLSEEFIVREISSLSSLAVASMAFLASRNVEWMFSKRETDGRIREYRRAASCALPLA